MLTMIRDGAIDAPAPIGRKDMLALGGRIATIGAIDRRRLGLREQRVRDQEEKHKQEEEARA